MVSKVTRRTDIQTGTHIPAQSTVSWAKFPSERKPKESKAATSPLLAPQVWNTDLYPRWRSDFAKSPGTRSPTALVQPVRHALPKAALFPSSLLKEKCSLNQEVSLTFPFCPIQQSLRGKTELEEYGTSVAFCCLYSSAWISQAMFWRLSLLSVGKNVGSSKRQFRLCMDWTQASQSEARGLTAAQNVVFWVFFLTWKGPQSHQTLPPSSVRLILLVAPRLWMSAFIRDKKQSEWQQNYTGNKTEDYQKKIQKDKKKNQPIHNKIFHMLSWWVALGT